MWLSLRAHPGFLGLCAAAAAWNFALNIAAPFFNVYVIQELNGTATMIGLLGAASSLASLPGQRLFGQLSDRWGPRKVQLLVSLLIPALPLMWVFVTAAWQGLGINLLGGFLWAGMGLAAFNTLLEMTPDEHRPTYTAIYQIVVLASLAGGAALGGALVSRWGYDTIFITSAAGRVAAALLFAWVIRPQAVRT